VDISGQKSGGARICPRRGHRVWQEIRTVAGGWGSGIALGLAAMRTAQALTDCTCPKSFRLRR
jgi:hypothetical protein